MSGRDGEIGILRRLLADEPRSDGPAASGHAELERAWDDLELPPVAPPPLGLAGRILTRARAERRPLLGLPWSPVWARAAATLALVAGLAGGTALGLVAASSVPTDTVAEQTLTDWSSRSLAEDYLSSSGGLGTDGGSTAGSASGTTP